MPCYKSPLSNENDRELAQLVERHPYKVDVAGSNPVLPTKFSQPTETVGIFFAQNSGSSPLTGAVMNKWNLNER